MSERTLIKDFCIHCHEPIEYPNGERSVYCSHCHTDIAVIQLRGYRDERAELKAELQRKQEQIETERLRAEADCDAFLQEKKALQAEQKRLAGAKQQAEDSVKELLHSLDEMGRLGQVMNAVAQKQDSDSDKLDAVTNLARKLLAGQSDFSAQLELITEYNKKDADLGRQLFSLVSESGAEQSAQLNRILSTGSSIQSGLSEANGKLGELNSKLKEIDRKQEETESALRSLKAQGNENSKKLDSIAEGVDAVRETFEKDKHYEIREIWLEANRLKAQHRFDEAYKKYQSAIEKGGEDLVNPAELHWRKLQCRYGVEYVWSDYDGNAKPTLYRINDLRTASGTDEAKDVLAVCADAHEKTLYESELHDLDSIIKRYKDVHYDVQYDVFISVKQQDRGTATTDSDRARALWQTLTQKGYKVFNSAISSPPPGENYEPYILAAMRSAKVMIVVAGSPEYMEAPWIKNEWGRFLWMKENEDRSRKLLPYLFGRMKANQMPNEIQSRNIQAIQEGFGSEGNLLGAIEQAFPDRPSLPPTVNVQSLLKRVFIYLEDGDWQNADQYCEKVLNIDPENGKAYLGKLMAELHVRKEQDLKNLAQPFDGRVYYQKVMRFGDAALKERLKNDNKAIRDKIEYDRRHIREGNGRSSNKRSSFGVTLKTSSESTKTVFTPVKKRKKSSLIVVVLCVVCAGAVLYALFGGKTYVWENCIQAGSNVYYTIGKPDDIVYEETVNEAVEEGAPVGTNAQKYAVGSIIQFGNYPQSKSGNNRTPIEWQVLALKGNHALLISLYGLEQQPYHTIDTDITWEYCSLRSWLNDDFFNEAFAPWEQKLILWTDVDNSASQGSEYSVYGGKDTTDRVFLLSHAEVMKYFTNDAARMCPLTDLAAEQQGNWWSSNGHKVVNGRMIGFWWLRSPGDFVSYALQVGDDGMVYQSHVDSTSNVVRPALWIDLSGI